MTEGYPALETYVAVLSTAPVGPSDQIGTANKTLIKATWSVKNFSLIQGWRMLCKSEGAQASGMRTISHLGGSGGMLPHENLEFLTSRECF